MKNLSKTLLSLFVLFITSTFALSAKIWMEPSQGDLISQCSNEIDIMIDTEWVQTNTVGVSFYIDDTVFALNELDTVWWIFPAYTSFVRWIAWHGDKKGQQTISFMWTTARKEWFQWKWKIWTLNVVPLLWAKSFDVEFYAISWFSADDSNVNYTIDGKIYDALQEAIGWKYTIVEWDCPLYEAPVLISEYDHVVLKTQENDTFFPHQMSFLKRLWNMLISNVNYIIISILVLLIILVLLKKKNHENDPENIKK